MNFSPVRVYPHWAHRSRLTYGIAALLLLRAAGGEPADGGDGGRRGNRVGGHVG
jgi:hypothetical protein